MKKRSKLAYSSSIPFAYLISKVCSSLQEEGLSTSGAEALLIGRKAFLEGKGRLSSYSNVLSFAVTLSFSLSF